MDNIITMRIYNLTFLLSFSSRSLEKTANIENSDHGFFCFSYRILRYQEWIKIKQLGWCMLGNETGASGQCRFWHNTLLQKYCLALNQTKKFSNSLRYWQLSVKILTWVILVCLRDYIGQVSIATLITSKELYRFPSLSPRWVRSNFHFSPYKHISVELFNKRHPLLGLIRSFLFSFIIFAWLCKVLLLLVKLVGAPCCAATYRLTTIYL